MKKVKNIVSVLILVELLIVALSQTSNKNGLHSQPLGTKKVK